MNTQLAKQCIAIFVLCAGSGTLYRTLSKNSTTAAASASPTAYGTSPARNRGELVLVYIGKSTCAASNDPTTAAAFSAMSKLVDSISRSDSIVARRIAIIPELSTKSGLKHASRVSEFDEISVGSGWSNTALREFVTGDFPGAPATPQVALILRLPTDAKGDSLPLRWAMRETQVVRFVGADKLAKWLEDYSSVANETRRLVAAVHRANQTRLISKVQ